MLVRAVIYGFIIVGACFGALIGLASVTRSAVVDVTDDIDTVNIRSCYVTLNPDAPLRASHVSISRSSEDRAVNIDGTQAMMCSVRLRIPTTRTKALSINAVASTLILDAGGANGATFNFPLDVGSDDRRLGTLRVALGGAVFLPSLNVSAPSGIVVVDTTRPLPPYSKISIDWGVVSVPVLASTAAGTTVHQKVRVSANATLGGYCISDTAPTLTYTTQDLFEYGVNATNATARTLVDASIYAATPAATTTSTIDVNCTSIYVTSAGPSSKARGAMMNATQKVRPVVVDGLRQTAAWKATQINELFVQVVEMIAPYASAIVANTNSAFHLTFGTELMSLLSGFVYKPSYRKFSSALSHYYCDSNTHIAELSVAVLHRPFEAETAQSGAATQVRTERFIRNDALARIALDVDNYTAGVSTMTAVSTVAFDLDAVDPSRALQIDAAWYTFTERIDGGFSRNRVRRTGAQWAMFVLSLAIGTTVAVVALSLCVFYRDDLLRVLYLHEARGFVRELTRRRIPSCPYYLYVSLFSFHSICAFQVVRFATAIVYRTFPFLAATDFIRWALHHADASGADDASSGGANGAASSAATKGGGGGRTATRTIPLTQLLEKYALMFATRYQNRVDLARAAFIDFLKKEGFVVELAKLSKIIGIAPSATSTERGGHYVFNELYRTTGRDFDFAYASAVANDLFLSNPLLPNSTVAAVLADAQSMRLRVQKADDYAVTNAKWSRSMELEATNPMQTHHAEQSFASFPNFLEVRPSAPFPERPASGSWLDARDDISYWAWQRCVSLLFGTAQGAAHIALLALPGAIVMVLASLYVGESTKYSLSTQFLSSEEIFIGFFTVDVSWLSLQNIVIVGYFCFLALAFIEPLMLLFVRLVTDDVSAGEVVLRSAVSGMAALIYLLTAGMSIAYFAIMLLWWVLTAIFAPNVLLAFASSAIAFVGALVATWRSLAASKERIVDRVKEKLLEALIDFLRKTGIDVDSLGGGASGGNKLFGVDGINLGLVMDFANNNPEATEKLAVLLRVPAPVLLSVSAVQSGDPALLARSTHDLLRLCDVPERFVPAMQQVVLRAMGVPAPMSALLHALYELHPDQQVRLALRGADSIILPATEAILHDNLADLDFVIDAIIAAGTEYLVNQSKAYASERLKKLGVDEAALSDMSSDDSIGALARKYITREQVEKLVDWMRSATSEPLPQLPDGSIVASVSQIAEASAIHAKRALLHFRDLVEALLPILIDDVVKESSGIFDAAAASSMPVRETIAQLVICALGLAAGEDDAGNAFMNLFLEFYRSIIAKKAPELDFTKSPEMLMLLSTISGIDPVFSAIFQSTFQGALAEHQLLRAGAAGGTPGSPLFARGGGDDDGDGEGGSPFESLLLEGEDEEAEEQDEYEMDELDASQRRIAGAASAAAASAAVAVAGSMVNAEQFALIGYAVRLLDGVIKISGRSRQARTLTTLLAVIFTDDEKEQSTLIASLTLDTSGGSNNNSKSADDANKSGAGGAQQGNGLNAAGVLDDAKTLVNLYVTAARDNCGGAKPPTRDKLYKLAEKLKKLSPIGSWLGWHWCLLVHMAFPPLALPEAAVMQAFRPNNSSMKRLFGVSRASLEIFENAAMLAIAMTRHLLASAEAAVGVTAGELFEIVQQGFDSLKRVLPTVEGGIGRGLDVVRRIFPDLAAQLEAPVMEIVSTATGAATNPLAHMPTAGELAAAGAGGVGRALRHAVMFPRLLFRVLRGGAPDLSSILGELAASSGSGAKSFFSGAQAAQQPGAESGSGGGSSGGGGSSSSGSSTSFVITAKNVVSVLSKLGVAIDDSLARLVTGALHSVGDLALLLLSTCLSGSKLAQSVLGKNNTPSMVFARVGKSIFAQIADTTMPGDVAAAALELLLQMMSEVRETAETLGRLARLLRLTPGQVQLIFCPHELVEQSCPWAGWLYHAAHKRYHHSERNAEFVRAYLSNSTTSVALPAKARAGLFKYVMGFCASDYLRFRGGLEAISEAMLGGDDGFDPDAEDAVIYRVSTPARQLRSRKFAILFCSMVGPSPFCLEAVHYQLMLLALADFVVEDLCAVEEAAQALRDAGPQQPQSTAASSGPAPSAGAVLSPTASQPAARSGADEVHLSDADDDGKANIRSGNDNSAQTARADADADAAKVSPTPPRGRTNKELAAELSKLTAKMSARWDLFVDMLETTCPVLSELHLFGEVRFSECATHQEIRRAVSLILENLQAAGVVDSSATAALTKAQREQLFAAADDKSRAAGVCNYQIPLTPSYAAFARICRADSKRHGHTTPDDMDMDGEGIKKLLHIAGAEANPFVLFRWWHRHLEEPQQAVAAMPMLAWFARCHGMSELDGAKLIAAVRSGAASAGGIKDDDDDGVMSAFLNLPMMAYLQPMAGVAALCTLLARRADTPAPVINKLCKNVPEHVSKLLRDVLLLRCVGPTFGHAAPAAATGSSSINLLRGFPALHRELVKLGLDAFAPFSDFVAMLHGATSGWTLAQAMGGGFGGLLYETRRPKESKKRPRSAGAAAAAAAEEEEEDALPKRDGAAILFKRGSDVDILKRLLQLVLREDLTSLAGALLFHLDALLGAKLGQELGFLKSLLLLLLSDGEIDERKLTVEAKERARELKARVVKEIEKRQRDAVEAIKAGRGPRGAAATTTTTTTTSRAKALLRRAVDAVTDDDDDDAKKKDDDDDDDDQHDAALPQLPSPGDVMGYSPFLFELVAFLEHEGQLVPAAAGGAAAQHVPAAVAAAAAAAKAAAAGIDGQISATAATAAATVAGAANAALRGARSGIAEGEALLRKAGATLNAGLMPLIGALRNPTQALLDMLPIDSDDSCLACTSLSACLSLALLSDDFDTATLCLRKLCTRLGVSPQLEKVITIIFRVGASAVAKYNSDEPATMDFARAITCDVLDLTGSVVYGNDEPTVKAIGVVQRLINKKRVRSQELLELLPFVTSHVLCEFMPKDKANELGEFFEQFLSIITNMDSLSEMSAMGGVTLDSLIFIMALLDSDLVVPKAQQAAIKPFVAFFKNRIMPLRRHAQKLIAAAGEAAAAGKLDVAKKLREVDLPVLLELAQFAATAAEPTTTGLGLPPDVSSKIKLVAQLVGGDIDAVPALLKAVGVLCDEQVTNVVVRVLKLVRRLSQNKALLLKDGGGGKGGGSVADRFLDTIIDVIFSEFATDGDGVISFNAFNAMLTRMRLSLPTAEAKELWDQADADRSGALDRDEVRVVIGLLQEKLFHRVLDTLGMSPGEVAVAIGSLGFTLALVLTFLLIGVSELNQGSVFSASVSGILPFFTTAFSRLESTVDQLIHAADGAVKELMEVLNAEV